jgi:putative transcriptional regulator
MADRNNLSPQASELLDAVRQMKAGDKARVYSPEQILAIAARQATKLTQAEFAQLLDVSVDAIRDWEQGRRSPRGAARTLLRIAMSHPEVLEQLNA